MTSPSLDLAEDVALVTFALHQALESYSEASLPGGYKYHLFDGYPGFCDFAAAVAVALHRALEPFDIDSLLDIVDSYAAHAIAACVQIEAPISRIALAALAEETRRRAVRVGLATLCSSAHTQNQNYDETQTRIGTACFQPWSVAFRLEQVFKTTIYAATKEDAMALGQHLYRSGPAQQHFDRCAEEATDWWLEPSNVTLST